MSNKELLEEFLLPQRIERLREVLENRIVSITLVLENLHKDYNISAILRTCEGFGIQDVHVVPQPGEGKVFRTVTQGCHKWLSIHRHESVKDCLGFLRENGFRVLAGAFGEDSATLEEADFSDRVAVVFSNELGGASREVLEQVDGFFVIPMSGFSQSLNVSVAAGITLHHVLNYKKRRGEEPERIPPERAAMLMDDWIRQSVKRADDIARELRNRK